MNVSSAYGGLDEPRSELWSAFCVGHRLFSRIETGVGKIGVVPESEDIVDTIRGVGGIEYVYTKNFDSVDFDGVRIDNFQVEVGGMDYGMKLDGIIGFDFIQRVGLVVDVEHMQVFPGGNRVR